MNPRKDSRHTRTSGDAEGETSLNYQISKSDTISPRVMRHRYMAPLNPCGRQLSWLPPPQRLLHTLPIALTLEHAIYLQNEHSSYRPLPTATRTETACRVTRDAIHSSILGASSTTAFPSLQVIRVNSQSSASKRFIMLTYG